MTQELTAIEAEKNVIGACIIDSESIILLSGELKPHDFSDTSLGVVWNAMTEMTNGSQVVDLLTLSEWLRARGKLEDVGGQAMLAGLLSTPYTSSWYAEHYAGIVKEKSRRRQSLKLAGDYAKWIHDADVTDPDAKMMAALANAEPQDDGLIMNDDAWDRYTDLMALRAESGGITGLATGLADLDHIVGGLRDGSLIIIGARPHMGKTTLMECIADHVAEQSHRVLFASLEMSRTQLQDRRVARHSRLTKRQLEQGRHLDRAMSAIGVLQPYPIDYIDKGDLATDTLLSRAYKVKSRVGLGLIVVDYLQLLGDLPQIAGVNDVGRTSYISRRLKMIARELDVPILVASQLSRSVEQRQNKRPLMSDLRQSGSIEQDADVIMMMYREAYYNQNVDVDITECQVVKNRDDGTTGLVLFGFVDGRIVSHAPQEDAWEAVA